MNIKISNTSGESLQNQLIRQIKAQALSGKLQAGFLLPSIRAFAKELKVSVITIQRAYEHLERDGLIESIPAKGFFVKEIDINKKNELAKANLGKNLTQILANAKNEGLNKQEIIEFIINEINIIFK